MFQGERLYVPILQPVIALVLWSLVMLAWVGATRLPAMRRAGLSFRGLVGTRGQSLEGKLPDSVQWKSHNYSHLMEQPTLFYAVALCLAVMGEGSGANAGLAWVYVALRVVHSLIQATVNVVWLRFLVFVASTLTLAGLALNAAFSLLS